MWITGAQSRAARALLDMTQGSLAEAAGLSIATVVDFERHRRIVAPLSVAAIAKALETAGIVFLPVDGAHTNGVALRNDSAKP